MLKGQQLHRRLILEEALGFEIGSIVIRRRQSDGTKDKTQVLTSLCGFREDCLKNRD